MKTAYQVTEEGIYPYGICNEYAHQTCPFHASYLYEDEHHSLNP